jgi:hypothetical protein
VDLLPFLATTYDEALALWDASRPVLQPLLEADGLRLAFVVAHPPRGLFIDKEVWKMSDLRGVRILDDHPMTAKLATLAGAVPVQKPQGPLAQAFAADGIDAMIASIPTGITENAWTFVSDYYDLRVALPKSVVVFNRAAYAALDPEIQRAVFNASVAAKNRGWSTSAAANNDGIDLLRAKGMTVAAPTREVVDKLKQIGHPGLGATNRQRRADDPRTISSRRCVCRAVGSTGCCDQPMMPIMPATMQSRWTGARPRAGHRRGLSRQDEPTGADLRANLGNAMVLDTLFVNVDLSATRGLETCTPTGAQHH